MKTTTYTIDAAGDPEPVTVGTVCSIITVFENAQVGTADYDVYAPLKTNTPCRRPAGSRHEFRAHGRSFFIPGSVIAYLAAATGSMTFAQTEE